MSKEFYTWEGKCKWAVVQKPRPKYNPDEGEEYSIAFYPKDDETRKEIVDTGIKNKMNEDEDGFFFRFRTDNKPWVCDSDGNKLDDLVGNGSDVAVRVMVDKFTSQRYGPVVRAELRSVRVDILVEYNPPSEEGSDNPGENPKAVDLPF